MSLDGGGVFDRVSANSDATLKLLIREALICGGESTEVTVGLDIVTIRIGVTVIPDEFSIKCAKTCNYSELRWAQNFYLSTLNIFLGSSLFLLYQVC